MRFLIFTKIYLIISSSNKMTDEIQDMTDVKCIYVINKSPKGSMRSTESFADVESNFQIYTAVEN